MTLRLSIQCGSQFARVVKGVDLRSTAGNCAWARTPQLTHVHASRGGQVARAVIDNRAQGHHDNRAHADMQQRNNRTLSDNEMTECSLDISEKV